jgi:hypothetical protein
MDITRRVIMRTRCSHDTNARTTFRQNLLLVSILRRCSCFS